MCSVHPSSNATIIKIIITHYYSDKSSAIPSLHEDTLSKEVPVLLSACRTFCRIWARACRFHSEIAWITVFTRKDKIVTNSSYIDLCAPKCYAYCACLLSGFPDNALLREGYHTIPFKWIYSARKLECMVIIVFLAFFPIPWQVCQRTSLTPCGAVPHDAHTMELYHEDFLIHIHSRFLAYLWATFTHAAYLSCCWFSFLVIIFFFNA